MNLLYPSVYGYENQVMKVAARQAQSRLFPPIDARRFQIVYLSGFLLFGQFFLHWELQFPQVLVTFLACISTQFYFIWRKKAHPSSWMSGLITALGLCLLLRSANPSWSAMAGVLAISSKFLLRFRGKHLFNPANFGIILPILLGAEVWISPGQWGSSVLFLFLIASLGSILLFKVGRLDITLTFLLVFIGLEFCRTILYLGWEGDVLWHRLQSGSFLLFAFFMITDPKTTPDHPRARIIWASALALITFFVSNWQYIHTAPIWTLFFITPLTALLDHRFLAGRFLWLSEKRSKTLKS